MPTTVGNRVCISAISKDVDGGPSPAMTDWLNSADLR
jgi:hypothetical protein